MAYFAFTDAILAGRRIKVFNRGDMRRDFTYVDDVVTGVLAALDRPPSPEQPHRIYNLGNSRPVALLDMIRILEELTGREAELELLPPQPGELTTTCADTTRSEAELGFRPTTELREGLRRFVHWFRAYHGR
jgi:UDP-glucuronate 4-epimerase